MEKSKLKQYLLELLDDDDIKDKIKLIINSKAIDTNGNIVQEEGSNLQVKIEKYDKKIAELIQEVEELKEENNKLKKDKEMLEFFKKLFGCSSKSEAQEYKEKVDSSFKENKNLEKEINSLNNNLLQKEQELKELKENFEEIIYIHNKFNNLSNDTKKAISNIFKDTSIQGFLACGLQDRNIDNLWEYIKISIINENNKDIANLIDIFNFLFSLYTKAFPYIQKQQVSVGDKYDPTKYIKSSNSNVSGEIKEIILYGWENTNTGKIIKESVVRV